MRRHKASVEVKGVIGILCHLLTATGLQYVPSPETFRRAKFGEVNVEDQIWQLLANILQTSTLSMAGCTQLKNVTPECKMLVSTGLWRSGYYAGWVYGAGEARGVSSRELLVALGWLLAAGMLEKRLSQRVQQLDKTLVPPILMKVELPQEPLVECNSVRRLEWLTGSLRHQGRMLMSMQDERASLLHAVLSASQPSRSSSPGQSCAVLRETCTGVQELCDLLELYLKWKQVENVFWTWMEASGLTHEQDAGSATEMPSHTRAAAAASHPGQRRAVEKLDHVLLKLKTVQEVQRPETGDVKDPSGRLQSSTDTLAHAVPSLESLPPVFCVSRAYRSRFQAGKRVTSFHGPVEQADELQASQVIGLLTQTERKLLEGRNAQRLAKRMQLQDMIGTLDQLVFDSAGKHFFQPTSLHSK
ncbi:tubulin epsilon and delta complex protein 1 [Syngnathus acus]|uniref:tubulin epsilon and delta complex protein 1 n=1 Tax=Syngnathus acus TaxID=161584 RepID=UPI001885FC56|nr:tubulin epsilon and delta complex protein 1 [Syngnathus acus]